MIRVSQLKLNIDHDKSDVIRLIIDKLRINESELLEMRIARRSLDARHKDDIHYVYAVDVTLKNEERILKKCRNDRNISVSPSNEYVLPEKGSQLLGSRPYIIGAGPAGLFCAYFLALYGFKPVLVEQGEDIDSRQQTVESFLNGISPLDPLSNIQFGEGGAGAFSDGKLNSSVKDNDGRKSAVLRLFHEFGASEDVMYSSKPHVGTDVICRVVKKIRKKIVELGGDVRFRTRFTGFEYKDGKLHSIKLLNNGKEEQIYTNVLVLAIGHSSRDTFQMLFDKGIEMTAKPFAVGVRAEHLQKDINEAQYGKDYNTRYPDLPPADYKLTAHTKDGHSVYSFCMCPGGYVINSSSETGHLCVNGMSYSDRGGVNANSAIVVNVTPDDISSGSDPLAGVRFQRILEEKAFEIRSGAIPVQRLEDFKKGKESSAFGRIIPQTKGTAAFADISSILPGFISADIAEAFETFGGQIKGFDDPDTILTAVESRTSSPVRIVRDTDLESSIKGIYPCGEGAGYAGGITSAAIDGIRVFEAIYRKYRV